jgi:hypothetical protein
MPYQHRCEHLIQYRKVLTVRKFSVQGKNEDGVSRALWRLTETYGSDLKPADASYESPSRRRPVALSIPACGSAVGFLLSRCCAAADHATVESSNAPASTNARATVPPIHLDGGVPELSHSVLAPVTHQQSTPASLQIERPASHAGPGHGSPVAGWQRSDWRRGWRFTIGWHPC